MKSRAAVATSFVPSADVATADQKRALLALVDEPAVPPVGPLDPPVSLVLPALPPVAATEASPSTPAPDGPLPPPHETMAAVSRESNDGPRHKRGTMRILQSKRVQAVNRWHSSRNQPCIRFVVLSL